MWGQPRFGLIPHPDLGRNQTCYKDPEMFLNIFIKNPSKIKKGCENQCRAIADFLLCAEFICFSLLCNYDFNEKAS